MGRSKKKRTRQSCALPLVGGPADFIPNEVPTLRDCLRRIQSVKLTDPSQTNANIIKEVSEEVMNKWQRSNALFREPITVGSWSIFRRLKKAYDHFNDRKLNKRKTMKKRFDDTMKSKLDSVFDVLQCKCEITLCNTPCKRNCSVSYNMKFKYVEFNLIINNIFLISRIMFDLLAGCALSLLLPEGAAYPRGGAAMGKGPKGKVGQQEPIRNCQY